MATTQTSHHGLGQRGPATRARGLDPEITAQPRLVRDDIGLSEEAESAGSIDPDDLAVHFLSEAIQQGDFDARRETEREAELFETTLDEELDPETAGATENTVWDYLLERSLKSAPEQQHVQDESEDVDAEIRQVLAQLAESRARKAASVAPAAPANRQTPEAPKRAKMTRAARDVLLGAARSLRHVAKRLTKKAKDRAAEKLTRAK